MRTLKLTVAYDGTGFSGWQVQGSGTQHTAHSTQKPTIQGTLNAACQTVLREDVRVLGSGRTDAGVHAIGQVAHLKTRSAIAPERLRMALNGVLPPAISVMDVEEAPASFHAQFSAVSKRYRYQIVLGPAVLPFERPYVKQVHVPLNVALMRREAAALLGRHDMAAFQSVGRKVRDTRRTISHLSVRRQGAHLTIEVEADGFLYKMVRRIVGTLLEIGRGRLPPGTMAALLKSRDPLKTGAPVPAKGLTLVVVRYGQGN
ncbi:MAG: tRNA pseudouridine(38-40) synthase TruA [Candidatus Omnitrophica bacterium]|nr:tRNA pseudouridine(38-40) synthase TruA [Candidatus Omnitrophota bacterium]